MTCIDVKIAELAAQVAARKARHERRVRMTQLVPALIAERSNA
jgi:hypothetical protein